MRGVILLLLVGGCTIDEPAAGTICESAQQIFQMCGASIPLLTDGECTGIRRSTAICVVEWASDCDEAATLTYRPDICFAGITGVDVAPRGEGNPGSELFPPGGFGQGGPMEETGAACMDGEDNDGDGDIDCEDSACAIACGPEDNAIACQDLLDNDNDGVLDCADPDCGHICQVEADRQRCHDGLDNDLDGLVDCADPGCLRPEAGAGCGQ